MPRKKKGMVDTGLGGGFSSNKGQRKQDRQLARRARGKKRMANAAERKANRLQRLADRKGISLDQAKDLKAHRKAKLQDALSGRGYLARGAWQPQAATPATPQAAVDQATAGGTPPPVATGGGINITQNTEDSTPLNAMRKAYMKKRGY